MADSPYIVHVDANSFADVVVDGSSKQPVLVDVWADWCAPCKSLMPILEKLAVEYEGKFLLAKLDADANKELVQQLGVRGFPTCRLFSGKDSIDEFSGALPESEVRRFLDHYLAQINGDSGSAPA